MYFVYLKQHPFGIDISKLLIILNVIFQNKVGRPPLRDKYSEDEDGEFKLVIQFYISVFAST